LDRIDGEKALLAQFYFGRIIVLAQFYFYYKRRRTMERIQFYNTLGRLFCLLCILYSLIHNHFMLWVWSKLNFEFLTKYLWKIFIFTGSWWWYIVWSNNGFATPSNLWGSLEIRHHRGTEEVLCHPGCAGENPPARRNGEWRPAWRNLGWWMRNKASTNIQDEGLRIGGIGRQMNSKVRSVKQGMYRE
jgi:hypothetical protein